MILWLFYAVVSLLSPSDFPAAMSKLTAASRRVRQGKAFSFLFFGGSYPRVSRGFTLFRLRAVVSLLFASSRQHRQFS